MIRNGLSALVLAGTMIIWTATGFASAPVSETTLECLDCHEIFHPGIVAEWKASRHAATTPAEAKKAEGPQRKISSASIPAALADTAVGCYECHGLRTDRHADAFDHNGTEIHVVVSPDDCATCHATERSQYSENIMAHARTNLSENSLYQDLQRTILGNTAISGGRVVFEPAEEPTRAEGCYYCHGTRLEMTGTETRDTPAGELDFPVISGWPNQGVGRINLDGSKGACTACHTRHAFSMETARKPYTCKECHSGPDVPAFKVYMASKHGNLFSTSQEKWDFNAVPWTIGEDFTAPTCAVCHMSLLQNTDGEVINPRTHKISDRLGWRQFGLIYAHPQPKGPDTTKIRNAEGLPLPTDFAGNPATGYLIGEDAIDDRRQTMKNTCYGCHSGSWVSGHFRRLDHTIETSNAKVKTATDQMREIWQKGFAEGPYGSGGSPFDEAIEREWSNVWLIYANNIRFASAMAGGGDYGIFEDGRYRLTQTLLRMNEWLQWRKSMEVNPAKEGE